MEFVHEGRRFVLQGHAAGDHLYEIVVRTGTFYEIDLLAYIRSLRLPRGLALDVGANIGNHAVYFASFLADHVIAVEPNPAVLPLLRANLQANCTNFTICEKGLGELPGRASIVLPAGAERNIGMAKLDTSIACGHIELTTLDALVEENASRFRMPVTFIKIDVEGMELEVLKGGINTIRRYRPHLFVEIASRRALEEIARFLSPLGYTSIVKWAFTPVHHFAHRPPWSLRLHALRAKAAYAAYRGLRTLNPLAVSRKT